MKTLTLLLCGLASSTMLNATVWTVSNEPGYPAQFTDVQAAHDAAQAGDTLYVTASATGYGTLSIDRTITVIGGGYDQGGPTTNIGQIYLTSGSDGSKIMSLYAQIYLTIDGGISDILIERVNGSVSNNGGFAVNGVVIKHCVLSTLGMNSSWTNVLITNNLISGQVGGSYSPSVLISNNVFASTIGNYFFYDMGYALLSNNIFYGSPIASAVSNCTFSNNLSYQTTDDNLPPTAGNNVGTGNLVGVDPLFVNVPDAQCAWTYDYHLQASSPGHNAGTDGTDIGLYGGSAPLNVPFGGTPRLPQVTQFDLLNSTIGQGGTINVQVQGAKHD